MTSYNAEKREAEKMMRAADEKLLIKELGPNKDGSFGQNSYL